mmetsp:Transcript_21500/g.44822  ORF Transcript_21500/g.44822 Transcript_21500/m.44822 type:complete len:132 (-) Transcript_21500:44-439(-)
MTEGGISLGLEARRVMGRATLKTYGSLLCLLLIFCNLDAAMAAKRKSSRRRRGQDRDEISRGQKGKLNRFFTTMKVTYIIMFLPVLATFFYSVARDPATPQIGKALWNIFKKKIVGYLGKPEDVDLENKRM